MIYVIAGKNENEARNALRTLAEKLKEKEHYAAVHELEDELFSESKFEEAVFSQGLFGKSLILCFGLLADEDREKVIFRKLKTAGSVSNDIIFFEISLRKKTEEWLTKQKARVDRYDGKDKKTKNNGAAFSVADAVRIRDKKKAWLMLVSVLEQGIPPEQIHGAIRWQLKDLCLRDFGGGAYTKNDLRALSSKLFRIYHDSHRGGLPLDLALEKFVLTL